MHSLRLPKDFRLKIDYFKDIVYYKDLIDQSLQDLEVK